MNQIIHYDNLFVKTPSDNKTFIFDQTIHQLQDITKINLFSFELPICFPNIRASNNSIFLSFFLNNINYKIQLPETNYNTIASLVTQINKSILAIIPAAIAMTFDINSLNQNRLIVTSNATSLVFTPSILTSAILGIAPNDTFLTGQFVCSKLYNLNPDSYICMAIDEIPNHIAFNSNIKGIFKIPLLNSYAQQLFFQGSMAQLYTSTSPLAITDKITVSFYDRWGYQLTIVNNFSFSLQFLI